MRGFIKTNPHAPSETMKFSDIPGHNSIKERMRRMVLEDHLPHAILLEGPAGIGKLALARAFAQYIQCENRDPDGNACGVCRSCRLHQSMNHVDTHYSYPVVKLDNMNSAPSSEDFYPEWSEFVGGTVYSDIAAWTATFSKRNAKPVIYVAESEQLIRKLAFTSHVSRYKIVIMWLPERLHETAANKLLKMIEEPFEDTIFILVSNSPAEILPTIYSRVQRLATTAGSDCCRKPDDPWRSAAGRCDGDRPQRIGKHDNRTESSGERQRD